jgi:hypothetical protein
VSISEIIGSDYQDYVSPNLAESQRVSSSDLAEIVYREVSVKALGSEGVITIGDHGRYVQGAQIVGCNTLGSGSQVLGPIVVQGRALGASESYGHRDPDLRGAILKGAGLARDLVVGQGEVISWREFRASRCRAADSLSPEAVSRGQQHAWCIILLRHHCRIETYLIRPKCICRDHSSLRAGRRLIGDVVLRPLLVGEVA